MKLLRDYRMEEVTAVSDRWSTGASYNLKKAHNSILYAHNFPRGSFLKTKNRGTKFFVVSWEYPEEDGDRSRGKSMHHYFLAFNLRTLSLMPMSDSTKVKGVFHPDPEEELHLIPYMT